MLFVAAADLDAWEPRRTTDGRVAAALDATPGPVVPPREAELTSRLDWLASVRASGPGRPSLDTIGQRLVADLGVARVVVWKLDIRNQRLVRLTSAGQECGESVDTVALRDVGVIVTMLPPGLQPPDDRLAVMVEPAADQWQLVAPVRLGRQLLGLVTIVGAAGQPALSVDAVRWADLLVSLIIDTLVDQRRTAVERQRGEQLQTLIDALPDAAAIADESGRVLVANMALRIRFGLEPESLTVGVDLPTLLGQSEHLTASGGKRSVVPRLRAILAAPEATTLPLMTPPSAGQGTTRLEITPVAGTGDPNDPVVASLVVVREVPPRPTRPPDPDVPPPSGATEGLVAIDQLVDFVTALGTGAHLDDVLVAGIDELRAIFGASAGSILLRREDGMLVRLSPTGFVETSTLKTVVDPATLTSARAAIGERRTILLLRSSADSTELQDLDRAGSDGGLIIPLLAGEEVIGLAVLAFFAEPTHITTDQIALATGLGRYLAVAVTNARNWDRWGVAQRHLLTVIDQLPQGVIVIDATDGSLSVANRAADDLWGKALQGTADTDDVRALGDVVREASTARTMTGGMAVHDAEGHPFPVGESPMERTLRDGKRRLGEPLTIRRDDGSIVRVIGNHVPIMADDGRIVSGVGVFQDIEELREVDQAKDEFLSVVAHELRNPLTSLRGNMQLVQRRLQRQGDPARAEDVERLAGLIAQTDRINELVSRLLDVSRADLDRIVMEYGECDGAQLVASAVETARGLTARHTIVLEAPDTLRVAWDRIRVEQVIGNLLSNAIKYTAHGEIRVTLGIGDDGLVEMAVADQGDGIPESVKARVFERYYRGTQETPGSEGLGIGLYISSRIVAAHRGTLTVSDGPGGGSVFTVRLPIDVRVEPETGTV